MGARVKLRHRLWPGSPRALAGDGRRRLHAQRFWGETISPVDTFLQYHLAEMDPRQAEPQLVRNGVSHLIGRPATLARYESLPEWQRIWASDRLAVLEHMGPVNLAAPSRARPPS